MRALVAMVLVAVSPDALADAKAGEKKAQLCLLCHKPGVVTAYAPNLAAQQAKYLVAATTDYKTGKRSAQPMTPNVAKLSARDISDIADYFASMAPVTATDPVDPAKVAAGERRVKELKCAGCHQAAFQGLDLVPRLAGQSAFYLAGELEAFSAGRRAHPAVEMPASNAAEFENIASYLSTLK